MNEQIKRAGRQISIYMGITMSFFLSLFENIISGHFSPILFFATFIVSTTLSFVIGFFVPMGIIISKATANMKKGGLPEKLVSSLISDLIFTPVLTLAMIALVRVMIPAEALSTMPPFHVMFVGALIPGMIVGYVLIMIFTPIYQKMVFNKLNKGKADDQY